MECKNNAYIGSNNPFFENSSVYLRQDDKQENSKKRLIYFYEEVRLLHIYISL